MAKTVYLCESWHAQTSLQASQEMSEWCWRQLRSCISYDGNQDSQFSSSQAVQTAQHLYTEGLQVPQQNTDLVSMSQISSNLEKQPTRPRQNDQGTKISRSLGVGWCNRESKVELQAPKPVLTDMEGCGAQQDSNSPLLCRQDPETLRT